VLSEQSAPVARATLPAVGAAIGNITELFYRKLFEFHPELLRDLPGRLNDTGHTVAARSPQPRPRLPSCIGEGTPMVSRSGIRHRLLGLSRQPARSAPSSISS
jgi:hypothetical protein